MTGGLVPPVLVTEKVSVRHCVACVAGAPAAMDGATRPFRMDVVLVVAVDGPVIANVTKSKRNWSERGIYIALHC